MRMRSHYQDNTEALDLANMLQMKLALSLQMKNHRIIILHYWCCSRVLICYCALISGSLFSSPSFSYNMYLVLQTEWINFYSSLPAFFYASLYSRTKFPTLRSSTLSSFHFSIVSWNSKTTKNVSISRI